MRGTLSSFCTRKDLQKKISSVNGVYGVVFRWKAGAIPLILSLEKPTEGSTLNRRLLNKLLTIWNNLNVLKGIFSTKDL